jgi:uncharacterized protein (TIGR02452 family)
MRSPTAIYTDCAIWSPDVVFFRDDKDYLVQDFVKASVLTLPAVNLGAVVKARDNVQLAKSSMLKRMKYALAIFKHYDCERIILGAYGCGVFGNDPNEIALNWKELIKEYGGHFKSIRFAVLDNRNDGVFNIFRKVLKSV